MVAQMEPQGLTAVIMVGSHILLPPLEPPSPQIPSTTFKVGGVYLGTNQLRQLRLLAREQDKQRRKVIVDEDWCSLLDLM